MKLRTMIIGAAAVVVALVGIGGYALGAVTTKPIHACYESKAPHAIVKDATCPKGYTALEWNIRGPKGRKGPRGSRGPDGDTAGPTGLNIFNEQENPVSAAGPSAVTTLTAECPFTNPYVVSGGYATYGSNPTVLNSTITTTTVQAGATKVTVDVWTVTMILPSGGGYATAMCSE